ncbi:MAG TPA: phage tail protein [Actinomycetota bacterium]|nr:phage tail protein [Actinomycetota bacterium]
MSDTRVDPFRAFNFRLEIDGIAVAAFSEASGLTSTGEAVNYRTGVDIPLTPRKLIGQRTFGPITLKRGMVQDDTLWDWYRNIATGSNDRRNGSVVLQDELHTDVLRWNFENAWPNKIEGPTLNASGNEVAVESVELVVEDIILEVA